MAKAQSFSTSLFTHRWIPARKHVPRADQKLMIVLHGRGDSIDSYRNIHEELDIPNMNYLCLSAPRKYDSGYSWYAVEPRHERGIKGARAKLFALIEELRAEGFKTTNIFLMGHSQGCLVACDFVLNHPATFGGLIGVSGYVWFFRGWRKRAQTSGARRTPWLMTHGTRDRVIRPAEIREDITELTQIVPVLYREFSKGHDFCHEEEVPFIRDWVSEPRARRKALCAQPWL